MGKSCPNQIPQTFYTAVFLLVNTLKLTERSTRKHGQNNLYLFLEQMAQYILTHSSRRCCIV